MPKTIDGKPASCTPFLFLLYNANIIRRQWTSFLAAASTAGYVYIYSFYYFFFKTKWVDIRFSWQTIQSSKYLKLYSFDALFSQNVWSLPNGVLFRLHGIVQLGPRYHVRNGRLYRYQRIRAKDIFHGQDRLKVHHWLKYLHRGPYDVIPKIARATLAALNEMKYILHLSKAAVRHVAQECDSCFSALLIIDLISYVL